MMQEHFSMVLDDTMIGVDEVASNCAVDHACIVEFVQAGVLLADPARDPARWTFTSRDLLRARRLRDVARQFDANAELAGLVVDLVEELERLRTRLRRESVSPD
jgi:chaperone modulatory protein CbpM